MTQAQLPSMPGTVVRLLQMFADPKVCIDDIVNTVRVDPALSGRLLKAANSSAVGASREVSDLKRAAMLLGKKTVSTLSLSFSLADRSLQAGNHRAMFQAFWNMSIVTGVAASRLAVKYSAVNPDEAFMAGLLCRIGRLGALSFAPDEFAASSARNTMAGKSPDRAMLSSMGMTPEELTVQYMRAWMLPQTFVNMIIQMQEADRTDIQRPANAATPEPSQILDASTVLRAAAALGQFFAGENSGIALATVHELMSPLINGDQEKLETLVSEIREDYVKYAEMLQTDTSSVGTPAELHARAMMHLTEIAMMPERVEVISEDDASSAGEIDWLKKRLEDLTYRLTIDSMTSVRNRSYFDQQLERQIAVARLTNRYVAMLFIDLNRFKQINDTYGHDAGDEVICAVASNLQKIVRRDDIVARYGGDEFVILCEMSERNGLEAQSQRIVRAMNGLHVLVGGHRLEISMAIGGAIGTPDSDYDFAGRLIREADEAMYAAKKTGANPVVRVLSAAAPVDEASMERVSA